MSPEEFGQRTGVSRETVDRFRLYESLLKKWQKSVNLVGAATLSQIWARHFFDSAQLAPHLRPLQGRLVDLGSGAGFPGLVLSLILHRDVILVEANQKKSAFLREVARQTGAEVRVITDRLEDAAPLRADLVTARALAPLPKLLTLTHRHLLPSGTAFFLKGKYLGKELTLAQKNWMMTHRLVKSQLSSQGRLLIIRNLTKRHVR